MHKLTNNGHRDFGLNNIGVLRKGESVNITDSQLDSLVAYQTTSRWLSNGWLTVQKGKESKRKEKKGKKEKSSGVQIEESAPGWYRVKIAGIDVADKNLRKDEAQALADEYV